jgi:hypothetical protein
VALRLSGHDLPTILLSDWTGVRNGGYERSNDHAIIFCAKLTKARDYLRRGGAATAYTAPRGAEFFESLTQKVTSSKSVRNLESYSWNDECPGAIRHHGVLACEQGDDDTGVE